MKNSQDIVVPKCLVEVLELEMKTYYVKPYRLTLFAHLVKGNLRQVRQIVHAGHNIKIVYPLGFTPLMIAAIGGHTDLCAWLLLKEEGTTRTQRVRTLLRTVKQRLSML
jgi:hypothetical protein